MRGSIDPAFADLAARDCWTPAEIAKILRRECSQNVEIDYDARLFRGIASFVVVLCQSFRSL
jgi:hypothetical protein